MRRMLGKAIIAISLIALQPLVHAANDPTSDPVDGLRQKVDGLRQKGYSVTWGAPIFGQVLMSAFPSGFVPAFEKTSGNHYTRDAVPPGETVERWTQMLTITGDKGLASNANVTPKKFAEMKAAGWKSACPNSFSAQVIGDGKIGSSDAFVVVLSCGTSPSTAGQTSESALIVILRGETDYYTVQWAERSEKSDIPLMVTPSKWIERYKQLSPIKLCPIIQGEAAPYPSCIDKK
jgi:hypothetical protein